MIDTVALGSRLDKEEVMKEEGGAASPEAIKGHLERRASQDVAGDECLNDRVVSFDKLWRHGRGNGWLRSNAGDQQRAGR